MRTLFLETNAINSAYNKKITGVELKYFFDKLKLNPIISQHTTYELYRTFLNTDTLDIGKNLFIILKDLDPIYTCQTDTLLRREIKNLRAGESVNYIIETDYNELLQNAIKNAAAGNINDFFLDTITKREKNIADFHENLKTRNPSPIVYNKMESFELYRKMLFDENKELVQSFIKETTRNIEPTLNKIEVCKFLNKLNDYRALRTVINSNLYLNYSIMKNFPQTISRDKTDDFRHLVDSSYCTIFVSDDKELKKYAAEINPDIRVITFDSILNEKF